MRKRAINLKFDSESDVSDLSGLYFDQLLFGPQKFRTSKPRHLKSGQRLTC